MSVHRLKENGAWQVCAEPESCELLFHLPEVSVEEAEAIPLELLLPILAAIQPPTVTSPSGMHIWMDEDSNYHREYDLPAVYTPGESMHWMFHGRRHRENDRPAVIRPNGTREWWQQDQLHRSNGPAILTPDGRGDYWERGNRKYR